jgi:chemotaxis protein methyltransferase CheR
MLGPTLSPQVFAILNALIEERTGLHYTIDDREVIESKLRDRLIESRFESFLDYYYFLRYDPKGKAELDRAIDALVINETYFFRELEPLRRLVDLVIAPRVERGETVRIWSAACSTGEEPSTLAMLLDHRGIAAQATIVASDISLRALARAREGIYGARSLREPAPPDLAPYLIQRGEQIEVRADIRQRIDWRRINLTDQAEVTAVGRFDAILCRNVLFYFNDVTGRRITNLLSEALAPEGVLLVGVAESLLRLGTSLHCEERGGVFMYSKGA